MDIKHVRDGREYRLPNYPKSVDGIVQRQIQCTSSLGVSGTGTSLPFRDVITTNGDTLATGYEQTLSRLEQVTCAGYQVKVQWECEFYIAGIELVAHSVVCQSTLCTWNANFMKHAATISPSPEPADTTSVTQLPKFKTKSRRGTQTDVTATCVTEPHKHTSV